MKADDPRHGTYAGHVEHSLTKTPMCDDCRTAGTRYMKKRRMRIENGEQLTVDPIGARRRIQALMALGWTGTDIAHICGWVDRSSVLQILRPQDRGRGTGTRGILRKTDDVIKAAYDQLSMTVPEITSARSRVRNMARSNGYAPPLAWDDIDDPDAQPDLGTPARMHAGRPMTRDAQVEDAEWLADDGQNLTYVCARLGVTRETLQTNCRREGRSDVYARLARREPGNVGEISTAVRAAQRKVA